MNHLKWMGHSSTILEIQRNLRNDPGSCEVTLAGSNGSVRAHRFVLSSCSELLRAVLRDVPMDQEATIVVPDIRGSLLDSVLAFIYMGETNITSTNLSEFLGAINTLGIRSAISFECNTVALSTSQNISSSDTLPIKAISGIQIAHEELLEAAEEIAADKIETQNVLTTEQQQIATTRELDFLDVYEQPQHKITYSIEHMPVTSNTNEFILTENAGTFTLTQNAKLEQASGSDDGKMDETEDETDDTHIIEEYSSGGEPIIEIGDTGPVSERPPTPNAPVIEIKSKHKNVKPSTKGSSNLQIKAVVSGTAEAAETSSDDPLSVMKMETYSTTYDEHSGGIEHTLSLAVQAVISEGMSLQKAAVKYDLSKTVLWRRVRKHPEYMKTTRENPLLAVACERLKRGDSLKSISRDLDIPMSTLHRHKVRLAQQGRLPDYVTFKKRDSVTKDELKKKLIKAVHACVHEGMSQNHAANLFAIPKSTLWRHLQKRVAESDMAQGITADDIKEEVILS